MENSQNSSLITFLMNLGILPCLGILLLLFGLFFIFIKWLSHDKPEEYSDDEAVAALFVILFSIAFLLIASAFLVGAILNSILNSGLTEQPIHWF
jgi:hypothetical protein